MKLELFEEKYAYHIAWCDEEGEGGWVGQDHRKSVAELRQKCDAAKLAREWDSFEYYAIELAAREWETRNKNTMVAAYGYEFESAAQAKKFLAAMRAALKSAKNEFESGVPWPEWAKQAQAAGWKPPKGWKP